MENLTKVIKLCGSDTLPLADPVNGAAADIIMVY
jgi:hypothetical protein